MATNSYAGSRLLVFCSSSRAFRSSSLPSRASPPTRAGRRRRSSFSRVDRRPGRVIPKQHPLRHQHDANVEATGAQANRPRRVGGRVIRRTSTRSTGNIGVSIGLRSCWRRGRQVPVVLRHGHQTTQEVDSPVSLENLRAVVRALCERRRTACRCSSTPAALPRTPGFISGNGTGANQDRTVPDIVREMGVARRRP